MVHLFKSDDLAVQFEVSYSRLVTDPPIDWDVELTYSFYKPLDAILPMEASVYDTLSHLSSRPVSSSLVVSSNENTMSAW